MAYVYYNRGGMHESVHQAHIAVVNNKNELVFGSGNTEMVTFPRSSSKPFQAIPFVEFYPEASIEEIAVACGSHAGEKNHLNAVERILRRANLNIKHLKCGKHMPFDPQTQHELLISGNSPTVLHHNCSGKHAAMLAVCQKMHWDLEGYTEADHPVQQSIAQAYSGLTNSVPHTARDGCSVPAYALPLFNIALSYAHLIGNSEAPMHRHALRKIAHAMSHAPFFVGGTVRMDTFLMRNIKGLISKVGAEGFHAMAWQHPKYGALGMAIKFVDGGERGREVLALHLLKHLHAINEKEWQEKLYPKMKNFAGHTVGEITVHLT